MIRPMLIVCATMLVIGRWPAQAQTEPAPTDMTPSEFRQVLVDMESYLDSHKGTDLARQLAAISDNTLSTIYAHVANPRQLQKAVSALRLDDTTKGARTMRLAVPTLLPQAVAGSCAPGA